MRMRCPVRDIAVKKSGILTWLISRISMRVTFGAQQGHPSYENLPIFEPVQTLLRESYIWMCCNGKIRFSSNLRCKPMGAIPKNK